MRPLLAAVALFLITTPVSATTWYVRTDGGTVSQCTGQTDAAYPGSGTAQSCAYNNPQDAINAAALGDTIIIRAGDTFTGNFLLPLKSGSTFLTIQSSRAAELPEGVRVSPAQSSLFAKLQTTIVDAVLRTPDITASHHYKFIGIEFTSTVNNSFSIVRLGDSAQTSLVQTPNNLIFDRCYVHGQTTLNVQAGITLNSANTTVSNSYISEIHWVGVQSYGLGGWNGPGPFTITNNYIEAAGLNILFGGATPGITNLVPSDAIITGNYLFKPAAWKGVWTAVNLLELKNARRFTISNNVLENSWPDAQVGWAVIFNTFRDGGWEVVDDVLFSRNVIRNSTNGINLRGMDVGDTAIRMHRVTIADNRIEGLGSFGSEAKAFQLLNGSEDVEINHNTVTTAILDLLLDTVTGFSHVRFKFSNNLTPHGLYGVFSSGGAIGIDAMNLRTTNGQMLKNALIATPTELQSKYPDTYFPATAEAAAGLLGTDGLPVGVRAQIFTICKWDRSPACQ